MAKQTFTVGQVLTAAQLTSLQQTAMGGGAASAKTASYTLVAADAGTTISMTSTSATTITVNTGLFAAGDTIFIQNLGSGNCTVTAGTATVSTAGSTILPTNDAGILYFVSTGVAIFYDFIQTGAVSPLTTKGDLYGFSTLDARIPIGANGTLLTADSSESLGLKWAAPAGGGSGLTLITPTSTANSGGSVSTSGGAVTFTGVTSVSLNGVFTSTYTNYLIITDSIFGSGNADITMRMRASGSDTTSNYDIMLWDKPFASTVSTPVSIGTTTFGSANWYMSDTTNTLGYNYTNITLSSPQKTISTTFTASAVSRSGYQTIGGKLNDSTSYDGFTFTASANNFDGIIRVYGYSK